MTKRYVPRKTKGIVRKNIFLNLIIGVLVILLLGESILSRSMQKGVNNLEKRLGADIMIVPSGAKDNAEGLLLEGQRSNFYFDSDVYEKLKELDGVSEITAQYFLKSLSADCCSSEVEIIFYDPNTDFLIGPWIMNEYGKTLDKNSVVVGFNVNVENNRTIKLFEEEYIVAAQMAKTGTSLDDSVYFSFVAEGDIIKKAEEKGVFLTETQKGENVISSVYINLKTNTKIADVLKQCHLLIGDEFDVVYPKELTNSMGKHLENCISILNILVKSTSVLLFIILFFIINISINQRKGEIALFRITGNSKYKVINRLFLELIGNSICSSICGSIIGVIIIVPFGTYIGTLFDMPYLGPGIIETAGFVVVYILIVSVIVALAALYPVIHVCNMQPYLALRRETE